MNGLLELEPEQKLDTRDDKDYKVETIYNSKVYEKKVIDQLPDLYYLVSWKCYTKEESIWKPALVVKHLCKMISTFHKNYPEKFIAISSPKNSAIPMAKLTTKLATKVLKVYPKKKVWKDFKAFFQINKGNLGFS